jgi:hypothetical protein
LKQVEKVILLHYCYDGWKKPMKKLLVSKDL